MRRKRDGRAVMLLWMSGMIAALGLLTWVATENVAIGVGLLLLGIAMQLVLRLGTRR